jgi:hypothetical protein
MKVFKITFIFLILATIINAVRLGDDFPILQSLPLLSGVRPLKYELAGIIVLGITWWGCHRLRKNREKNKTDKSDSRDIYSPYRPFYYRDHNYRNYKYGK